MKEKTIPETGVTKQAEETSPVSTRESDRFLVPPVDIYETPDGLTVVADVAGVSKDGVAIQVENGVLTIRGRISRHSSPGLVYQEYDLPTGYFRQFELDERVDQGRIDAELRHGVLTIHLPKSEQARPKQIEVRVR